MTKTSQDVESGRGSRKAYDGLRLLAIHAHPDDESSKGAATMAYYVDHGADVVVLTCTGGERGSILNPNMDRPGVLESMTAIRREEMARAMEALGTRQIWLGYEDSGLPEGDPLPPLPEGCFALQPRGAVVEKIVGIMRRLRPHVIITYDENGGYPHPDHIKVHEVSMAAWDVCGDPTYHPELGKPWQPLKLYYTHGFIRQRLELFHNRAIEDGQESPYTAILERWKAHRGDIMARVTTRVPCADYFDQRDDALRAHATQIDPAGTFFATPVSLQQEVWPTEEFELACTRVATKLPETDLFAGIVKVLRGDDGAPASVEGEDTSEGADTLEGPDSVEADDSVESGDNLASGSGVDTVDIELDNPEGEQK